MLLLSSFFPFERFPSLVFSADFLVVVLLLVVLLVLLAGLVVVCWHAEREHLMLVRVEVRVLDFLLPEEWDYLLVALRLRREVFLPQHLLLYLVPQEIVVFLIELFCLVIHR